MADLLPVRVIGIDEARGRVDLTLAAGDGDERRPRAEAGRRRLQHGGSTSGRGTASEQRQAARRTRPAGRGLGRGRRCSLERRARVPGLEAALAHASAILATMKPTGIKLIAQNKKAYHDYFIEETLEAGIVLTGTEVKSLRAGRVNLRDSYAAVEKGELFLVGVHISPYEQGNIFNHDPLRTRKLLVHARELRRLYGKVQVAGYTLVPTKLYFKDGRAKVEIGLAKGKARTTSARPWPRRRPSATWRGPSARAGDRDE